MLLKWAIEWGKLAWVFDLSKLDISTVLVPLADYLKKWPPAFALAMPCLILPPILLELRVVSPQAPAVKILLYEIVDLFVDKMPSV